MKKDKLHLQDHFIKGISSLQKVSVFLLVALASLLGCKKDNNDNNNPPPQQVQTLSVTDTAFMRKATLLNLAEIDLGRLALANASEDSIKILGASVVNQHTLAQSELNALALQKNVLLPQQSDSLHMAIIQRLQFLDGFQFDSLFVSTLIRDDQDAVQNFTTETNSGEDQDVKNYANKFLPIINAELQRASRLQGTIVR